MLEELDTCVSVTKGEAEVEPENTLGRAGDAPRRPTCLSSTNRPGSSSEDEDASFSSDDECPDIDWNRPLDELDPLRVDVAKSKLREWRDMGKTEVHFGQLTPILYELLSKHSFWFSH